MLAHRLSVAYRCMMQHHTRAGGTCRIGGGDALTYRRSVSPPVSLGGTSSGYAMPRGHSTRQSRPLSPSKWSLSRILGFRGHAGRSILPRMSSGSVPISAATMQSADAARWLSESGHTRVNVRTVEPEEEQNKQHDITDGCAVQTIPGSVSDGELEHVMLMTLPSGRPVKHQFTYTGCRYQRTGEGADSTTTHNGVLHVTSITWPILRCLNNHNFGLFKSNDQK